MPVKRRQSKPRQVPISEEAIAIFERMKRHPRGCEAWYDLHERLFRELQLKPWVWPIDNYPVWEELAEAARLARQRKREAMPTSA
jgi:hypothetical protein